MFSRIVFSLRSLGLGSSRAVVRSVSTESAGSTVSSSSRRRVLGVVLFGIPIATTFGLGMWQAQRLQWKRGLIEEVKKNMAAEPLEIKDVAAVEKHLDKEKYRSIRLTGQFDHKSEVQIGPRPPITGGGVGYLIITPLDLPTKYALLLA